jgi:hypothetical protein
VCTDVSNPPLPGPPLTEGSVVERLILPLNGIPNISLKMSRLSRPLALQGANRIETHGDLTGAMVVCLDITGNYKSLHGEWSTLVGSGWSPSMTLSSLLVQLQTFLGDLDQILGSFDKAALIQQLEVGVVWG